MLIIRQHVDLSRSDLRDEVLARLGYSAFERQLFRAGLEELPSEVVLYWFTLCLHGYHQAARRAVLRMLFTHDEIQEASANRSAARRQRQPESGPSLFALVNGEQRAREHDTLLSSRRED